MNQLCWYKNEGSWHKGILLHFGQESDGSETYIAAVVADDVTRHLHVVPAIYVSLSTFNPDDN